MLDCGLGWKKLRSSWDLLYSIPILSKLQTVLQFSETGYTILIFILILIKPRKSIRGEKNKRRNEKSQRFAKYTNIFLHNKN